MTAPQKAAALKLLAATLSPAGYEKIQQIMEGDEVNQQQGGRRNQSAPDVRPGHFLYLDAGNAFATRHAVDAAVRRPSPRAQHHPGGRARRPDADAHRCTARQSTSWATKPCAPSKARVTSAIALAEIAECETTQPGDSGLPRGQSRAGPRRGWQDDSARGPQGHRHEREPARDAARPDFRVDRHHRGRRRGRAHGGDEVRHRRRRGLPGAGPQDVEAGSNVTAYYRIQGPHLVIEYALRAATQRCTSTRCIATRRTTTARS